ncbi:MAG TPA: DUF92 domain-containing protein [Gemmatimonadaceae bacterium]|nr:DUF92 domain-containing protein [Gemmatimonadaceae bacterium]
MLVRIASALVVSLAIALLARRSASLSSSGAIAATVVGTLALVAGWSWGILLVAYFVSSSILSRYRDREKQRLNAAIVEKGGARDALQVLANGGAFAAAALLVVAEPGHAMRWQALGAGVLATSASDTWATEIGTLLGGAPRSILRWEPMPRGMSGGVTLAGTLAACAGAGFVALVVTIISWPPRVALGAFAGGFVGSTIDSLLGATLQTRRWCDACHATTERAVHDCGLATRHAGGIPGFGNDAVNFVSVLVGGLLSLLLIG